MRVLTETGRPDVCAARMSSRARAGFLMSAAPQPLFSTARSGQPILISTPSNPMSAIILAAFSICSGTDVKSCATIGRSFSPYKNFFSNFFFPSGGASTNPSAEVNSVNITSGPPRQPGRGTFPSRAMSARNAASVTSSSGANAKKGFGSFRQKSFISPYYSVEARFETTLG